MRTPSQSYGWGGARNAAAIADRSLPRKEMLGGEGPCEVEDRVALEEGEAEGEREGEGVIEMTPAGKRRQAARRPMKMPWRKTSPQARLRTGVPDSWCSWCFSPVSGCTSPRSQTRAALDVSRRALAIRVVGAIEPCIVAQIEGVT